MDSFKKQQQKQGQGSISDSNRPKAGQTSSSASSLSISGLGSAVGNTLPKPGDGSASGDTLPGSGVGSASSSTQSSSGGVPSGKTTGSKKSANRNARRRAQKQAAKGQGGLVTPMTKPPGKRPLSEDSSQSPGSSAPQSKKTKSYGEVASPFKVAITKEGFPVNRITEAELGTIQCGVLERVDGTPSGEPLPRIKSFTLESGAIHYVCSDESTEVWLRKAFHGNESVLEGTKLLVIKASELPKPFKVAFKTKDIWTKHPPTLLKRLQLYNNQLNTGCWKTVASTHEQHFNRWIFQMDEMSVNALKEANFKAYTGVDMGNFKVIHNPNKAIAPSQVQTQSETEMEHETVKSVEVGRNSDGSVNNDLLDAIDNVSLGGSISDLSSSTLVDERDASGSDGGTDVVIPNPPATDQ